MLSKPGQKRTSLGRLRRTARAIRDGKTLKPGLPSLPPFTQRGKEVFTASPILPKRSN